MLHAVRNNLPLGFCDPFAQRWKEPARRRLKPHGGPAWSQRPFRADVVAQDRQAAPIPLHLEFPEDHHRIPDTLGQQPIDLRAIAIQQAWALVRPGRRRPTPLQRPLHRLRVDAQSLGDVSFETPADCAFFLQDVSELDDPERCFPLTAEAFARVNPNTGTAPIFRTRRDADLTTAIYGRLPVLVDRSSGAAVKAWPVKYTRMFDMTNDSGLFRTREEIEEKEGAYHVGGNRFASPSGDWVPLYEGKMVQAFDHRATRVVINPENQHRPAQPVTATVEQHQDPNWLPDPQFWVPASECGWTAEAEWVLGFKEITAPTNVRTFIAALLPTVGFGNKVPILKPEATDRAEWLLAANLNATILDFVARQKIQGQTLNLFIVEQLPVVPPNRYEAVRFGPAESLTCVANPTDAGVLLPLRQSR